MVLIDTSVWSVALRRRKTHLKPDQLVIMGELARLIREGRAQLIGPIRQELLSGIRTELQYEALRSELKAFDDAALTSDDYEEAARAANLCRARGIAGAPVDFLICAVAARRKWSIFTTDEDFGRYAHCVPVLLHSPRSA